MQIAQVLAGYSLGGADILRRAMGKKKAEEMANERKKFVDGASQNGIAPRLSENIFDLMEKFAGYGFNKSHSVAYALLAYQTAWLKAHYPAAFMAAVLSADMQNTEKVVTLIEECRAMKLVIAPPDVNRGEYRFSVAGEGEIIYGLGAIKGLGEGPVESIIAARASGGAFRDLFDFCVRIDGRKLNRRALEALIRAGALDNIGPDGEVGRRRAVMLAAMDEAIKVAEQSNRNLDSGMVDLFGAIASGSAPETGYAGFAGVRPQNGKERLQGERDTLGLYLTGHPVDDYVTELAHFAAQRISRLRPSAEVQTVAGLVVDLRLMKTKRGDTMAFVILDDRSGRLEVAVFADNYRDYREKIAKEALLVVEGVLSEDDYSGGLKMRAERLSTLYEAREAHLERLVVEVDGDQLGSREMETLAGILQPYRRGSCALSIRYRRGGAVGEVALGQEWAVRPEDDLIYQLRDNFGQGSLQLHYR